MLENLFSIVLYFCLGYGLKVLGLFRDDTNILIRFVVYVGAPALIVYNVYFLAIDFSLFGVLAGGWAATLICIAAAIMIGRILRLEKATFVTVVMMAAFGNTTFLGFPFIEALLGREALPYAAVYDQIVSFLGISILGPIIISMASKKDGPSIDWRGVITFPPFMALILAFLLKPLPLPDFFLATLGTLSKTVVPLAIFSIGLGFGFSKIKKDKLLLAIIIAIKMLFAPLVFVALLTLAGTEFSLAWKTGILQMAMPPMVLASIYIINAGLAKELAVASVGLGIILSFAILPAIYLLLG